MTISYNWLKDYLDCGLSPEEVRNTLTSIGLEVESAETVEEIPGGLKGVIVAEVVECEEHPDSDHLHVTKLNTGESELLQVVCGAPNVAAGQKVLLATIGTVLGEDFKIKRSRIRGIDSNGMICAEDELGIGASHEGIMVLDPSAVVGTAAKDYLHLECDTVFEIGLTANRVDAASHIGVARDLYAYLKLNNIDCKLNIPDVSAFREGSEGLCSGSGKIDGAIPVQVDCPDGAPGYIGTTISGLHVGPSPDWLRKRLTSIGLRSINNVVDITNFVLMEIGQPMHAFDAGKIAGGKVVVRYAKAGEKMVTLDGVERSLSTEDVMIADTEKSMCIAGVFGGLDSGTTEATTDLFLESAYFNPPTIRKTSKRHGLKTDASFRYERGADPMVLDWAARRASTLICELAGGHVVGKMQPCYAVQPQRKQVELDYERIERFIGKKIGAKTIEDILGWLGYEFVSKRDGGSVVGVPSYMTDVYRECDVVEEILRIYGYDNVEMPSGVKMAVTPAEKPEPEKIRNIVSDFLAANGFVETVNNSITKGDYYNELTSFPPERLVKLLNPLSSDLNVMRQTLLLNGLEVISYNINRQVTTLRTFEYGSVYSLRPGMDGQSVDSYDEHQCFALFMTGSPDKVWGGGASKSSYFALKGYVELLLRRFGANINNMEFAPAPEDMFSEGLQYRLPGTGELVVTIGTIAPARLRVFGIRQPVFAAEIQWNALYTIVKRDKIHYTDVPRFPEVRRDLALLLDEGVTYSSLYSTAVKTGKKLLKSVSLFDVYRGDKIPAGKKQYALAFVLQDLDKTLTDSDVENIMGRLLAAFTREEGAALR